MRNFAVKHSLRRVKPVASHQNRDAHPEHNLHAGPIFTSIIEASSKGALLDIAYLACRLIAVRITQTRGVRVFIFLNSIRKRARGLSSPIGLKED